MSCKRFPVVKGLNSHVVLWTFLDARRNVIVSRGGEIVLVILKSRVLGNTV